MRLLACAVLVIVVAVAVRDVATEERIDQDVYWKIRQEATNNSKVLATLHALTDVYGPRLTGSPQLKAAGEWAIEQMHAWGLRNGRLEPWDFGAAYGREGWTNDRLAVHLVSPVRDALVVEALAWTPGTNGPVRAEAFALTLPQRPTAESLAADLDRIRDRIRGKIVLVGLPQQVLVTFNPPALRRDDADVLNQLNAAPPQQNQQNQQNQAQNAPQARPLTNNEIQLQVNDFLVSSGAVVRINDAGRDHGQIRAFGAGNGNTAAHGRVHLPTVVMRNEDYGRV